MEPHRIPSIPRSFLQVSIAPIAPREAVARGGVCCAAAWSCLAGACDRRTEHTHKPLPHTHTHARAHTSSPTTPSAAPPQHFAQTHKRARCPRLATLAWPSTRSRVSGAASTLAPRARAPRSRLFPPTAPISPICRTPLFPHLTFYSRVFRPPTTSSTASSLSSRRLET